MAKGLSRPRWRVIVGILGLAVFGLAVVFLWMYSSRNVMDEFSRPKITRAHVDERLFERVPLGPGERYRPIEVMARTDVEATCEVVSGRGKHRFVLTAFGKKYESPDCVFRVHIPDQVGLSDTFRFLFFGGEPGHRPIDTLDVPVVTVEPEERFELHALENSNGKKVQPGSVPLRIKVYATLIAHLPNYKALVPLFFVAERPSEVPVLQFSTELQEGQDPRPVRAKLVRFRAYGRKLAGFAIWTEEPIQVGKPGDLRKVFDIYIGLFERDRLGKVLPRLAEARIGEDGSLILTTKVKNPERLKELSYQGRYLSPPFHVVRGTQSPVHVSR